MHREIFLTPIKSKLQSEIKFKLNSDDFSKSDIRLIKNYLKSNNYNFHAYRSYSKVKLMSWVTFKIKTNKHYIDFDENDILAKDILTNALK